jgi:hypothetical protein
VRLQGRLGRLEQRVRNVPNAPPPGPDAEGWLARFEECGQEGLVDAEPDYSMALETYRTALAAARPRLANRRGS